MNKILKENSVLWIGIFLPLLMVIIFWLATFIPRIFVSPPQYDLLFMVYNAYNKPQLKFNPIQGKLSAQLICNNCNATDIQNMAFYRFDVKNKKTNLIKIDLPTIPAKGTSFVLTIKMPELNNVTIDTSTLSPDGYAFNYENDNNGMLSELFFRTDTNRYFIAKNGNNVEINLNLKGNDYYYAQFVGWIIPGQGK